MNCIELVLIEAVGVALGAAVQTLDESSIVRGRGCTIGRIFLTVMEIRASSVETPVSYCGIAAEQEVVDPVLGDALTDVGALKTTRQPALAPMVD